MNVSDTSGKLPSKNAMRSGRLMSPVKGKGLEHFRVATLCRQGAAKLIQSGHSLHVVELAQLRTMRAQRPKFARHHPADVHGNIVRREWRPDFVSQQRRFQPATAL